MHRLIPMAAVMSITTALVSQVRTSPPGVSRFGTACGGAVPTRLSLSQTLRPGGASTLTITGMPVAAAAFLMTGWDRQMWGSIRLPLPLTPIGWTGCDLLVSPDATVPFPTGGGVLVAPLQLPPQPALVGLDLYFQTAIATPGANPAGMSTSQGLAARIGPPPTPTTMVSSITQFGITYQFAQPVQAGRFVNGDWFVVGPAQLAGILPPCTTSGGRVLNGAMVNPDPSTRDHGYDSGLYGPGNSQHYLPGLNVALGLSPATPLALQPDQSLVKIVSNTDPSLLPHIRTCSVLTCLAQVPPDGSFRPPYAGPDHEVRYDASMLDWGALAQLMPAAGMPSIATEAAQFERPWLDHCPLWVSRYMHPIENMPDYGRDFASIYNQGTLLCNLAVPQAQKELLLIRLVQIGIDFWGNVKNGCYWEGLGGHGSGRKWPILFAGRLLDDAEMLAVGQNFPSYRLASGSFVQHFGEDAQTFYVGVTGPGQINYGFGGYNSSHIGLPEWGFSHAQQPSSDHEAWLYDSYRRCCTANAWVGSTLCAYVMGLKTAWAHPALFDYMDRFMQTEPQGWTRQWLPWTGRMWDQYRASY